jgi:uncharacterized protein
MENPKFTILKGRDQQFYFNLKAKNGEIILSSEGYATNYSCRTGIASVKENAPYNSRYERRIAHNGQYYFILKSANWQVIGVSEMYDTTQGRENGIEAVKKDAPNAPIKDLT